MKSISVSPSYADRMINLTFLIGRLPFIHIWTNITTRKQYAQLFRHAFATLNRVARMTVIWHHIGGNTNNGLQTVTADMCFKQAAGTLNTC